MATQDDTEFDVEIDDEVDTEDENENEGENEQETNDWTPPTKETWEKTLRAKQIAKADAKKLRAELADLKANGGSGNGTTDTKTIERAKLEVEQQLTSKFHGIIGRSAAKAALAEAGAKGNIDRLIKLIDFDDLDIDETGEVDGLDEQIAELKKDYDFLFPKTRGSRDRDAAGRPVQKKQMTNRERAIAMALGQPI